MSRMNPKLLHLDVAAYRPPPKLPRVLEKDWLYSDMMVYSLDTMNENLSDEITKFFENVSDQVRKFNRKILTHFVCVSLIRITLAQTCHKLAEIVT
jgi:hypothetical protein